MVVSGLSPLGQLGHVCAGSGLHFSTYDLLHLDRHGGSLGCIDGVLDLSTVRPLDWTLFACKRSHPATAQSIIHLEDRNLHH